MKNEIEVINYLNKKYSPNNIEKWDFVGYSVKRNKETFNKILICLDVNSFVVDFAINNNFDLIISFHPFCFANSWEEVYEYDSTKYQLVKRLEENNISTFSIHTNYDNHPLGTRYQVAKKLNIENNIIQDCNHALVIKWEKSFNKLAKLIKQKTQTNVVLSNVNSKHKKINSFYIAPGSGDIYQFLEYYKTNKVDLIVTSDIKWNEQQLLNSIGINYMIISHKIEDVFVDSLKEELSNVVDSKIEIHGLKFDDFTKGY